MGTNVNYFEKVFYMIREEKMEWKKLDEIILNFFFNLDIYFYNLIISRFSIYIINIYICVHLMDLQFDFFLRNIYNEKSFISHF